MITNRQSLQQYKKYILWALAVSAVVFSYSHANSLEFEDNLNSVYPWVSNNYSDIHFNQNWNNFEWTIFWRDYVKLSPWVSVELTWNATLTCYRQIRWLYYNNQRWLRVRPLDPTSLSWLRSVYTWYAWLSFTWWWFSDCNNVDEDNIYGQITHTWNWITYQLIAWIDYNFAANTYTGAFSGSLKYTQFNGYIRDNNGGIWKVAQSTWINSPDDFYFDSIEEARLDTFYKSNIITISGLSWTTKVRATISTWSLFVSWVNRWTAYQVWNWDKIQIQLLSSSWYDMTVESEIFIGLKYGIFSVTTMADDAYQLTTSEKLQLIIILNVLKDYYKDEPVKQAQFLNTFQTMLKDRIDIMKDDIENWNEALNVLEVRKIALLEYLYDRLDEFTSNLEDTGEDWDIYVAPNGKEYKILFDDERQAYTSNNFIIKKYFANLDIMKVYIDKNNISWAWALNWNTLIAPNNKVYLIKQTDNNSRTSPDFAVAKYFSSFQKLRDYIFSQNKIDSAGRNHSIDTSFDKINYTAANGKSYDIYKTTTGKYFSYKFLKAIYFDSITSIKKFIDTYNKA